MDILIDFEATCWEKHERKKHPYSEITEISAIAVNASYKIIDEFSELIKPKEEPELSEYCIKLTGITQQSIDSSRSFEEVIKSFDDWVLKLDNKNKPIIVVAWGNYDQILLRKNLLRNNFTGEIRKHYKRFYNLQVRFEKLKHISGSNCKLTKALSLIGEAFEGKEHRGMADVKNMLKVYKYLCSCKTR